MPSLGHRGLPVNERSFRLFCRDTKSTERGGSRWTETREAELRRAWRNSLPSPQPLDPYNLKRESGHLTERGKIPRSRTFYRVEGFGE